MTVRARSLAHAGLIVALGGVTYAGSFDGAFVSDDLPGVRDNPLVRALGWASVGRIFGSFDGANYVPVTVLSLAVDARLWGMEPTGFHVTNLILHLANALLLYALLVRLALRPGAACLAAALWAVHPVQVESVAWISERKNVLSGLFFFAAFHAYLGVSARGRPRAVAALVALYVLALLSKMNTMVLPVLALAYEYTWHGRVRRRDVALAVPLLALAAGVAWYNLAGNPIHGVAYHGGSAVVTWLSTTVVVLRYLGHLVWPVGLTYFYRVPLRDSVLDPAVLGALLVLLAGVGLTVWLIVRRERGAFWLLWFAITLGPMLNLVPFRSLMQDRYLYLASVGPIALGAMWLGALATPGARRAAAVAGAAAVVACAVLGHRQVEAWTDTAAMWSSTADRITHAASAPRRLTADDRAFLAHLEEAHRRDPGDAIVRNNLAVMRLAGGRVAEAIAGFEAVARVRPRDPMVFFNLGRAYVADGRLAEAEVVLRRAVGLAPYQPAFRSELARVLLARGDAAGARTALETAARLSLSPASVPRWREWGHLADLERR